METNALARIYKFVHQIIRERPVIMLQFITKTNLMKNELINKISHEYFYFLESLF